MDNWISLVNCLLLFEKYGMALCVLSAKGTLQEGSLLIDGCCTQLALFVNPEIKLAGYAVLMIRLWVWA